MTKTQMVATSRTYSDRFCFCYLCCRNEFSSEARSNTGKRRIRISHSSNRIASQQSFDSLLAYLLLKEQVLSRIVHFERLFARHEIVLRLAGVTMRCITKVHISASEDAKNQIDNLYSVLHSKTQTLKLGGSTWGEQSRSPTGCVGWPLKIALPRSHCCPRVSDHRPHGCPIRVLSSQSSLKRSTFDWCVDDLKGVVLVPLPSADVPTVFIFTFVF